MIRGEGVEKGVRGELEASQMNDLKTIFQEKHPRILINRISVR